MLIRKIREWIGSKISRVGYRMYYFVPQCPVCKGWKTGRYVREPSIDPEYMYRKSLEHGELIRFLSREPIKNCFCTECGAEWPAHIQTVLLSPPELDEQKRLRGTNELYNKYREENFVNGRPPKSSAVNRWFF